MLVVLAPRRSFDVIDAATGTVLVVVANTGWVVPAVAAAVVRVVPRAGAEVAVVVGGARMT